MAKFWNRQRRRHLLIPVLAAVAGAGVALLVEWTVFRPRPVQLPVVVSTAPTAPPVNTLAPQELATRIKANPCVDLLTYVCSLSNSEDPTGHVRRDAEGEVEVLRIYEEIIRGHRRLTRAQIDEILVAKVYTPERRERIRRLFSRAKSHLLEFIEAQPFQALTRYEKQLLREKIERVRLELPPPAAVYADEPDLFTRNDVYYERTAEGRVRIRIGGALFFTVQSEFNLAFTLAHELAHAIDPCELRADNVDIVSYRGLMECFGSPADTLMVECSARGKLSEIFADWVATHVVADILGEEAERFTPSQTRAAVYNTVRDLCRDQDDDVALSETGLDSSHPNVSFRVNRIFAQHPAIRRYLGCRDESGPTLPGVPPYCFWPSK